jgi:chromatin segregation and condensation protein Rec8/ScpA/Scc1 (kleisin family)
MKLVRMKADEILKKHEDENEMHFHEVDRKWIIEAMEEYAALHQPSVSGRSEQLDYKIITTNKI